MKKLIVAFALLVSSVCAMAQSESFNNPELKKQWMCENESKVVMWTFGMKSRGMTKENMFAVQPLPEDWSAERKEQINRMIDQVMKSTKSPQSYVREYMDLCLKRVAS